MSYSEEMYAHEPIRTQGGAIGAIPAGKQETPAARLHRSAMRTEETTLLLRRLIEEITGEGFPETASCGQSTEVSLGFALSNSPDVICSQVEEQRSLINILRSTLLGT